MASASTPGSEALDVVATLLVTSMQAGVPLKVVSEQLGHSMQVTTGGPPGTRTQNLRIKSSWRRVVGESLAVCTPRSWAVQVSPSSQVRAVITELSVITAYSARVAIR